ncbi:MAG: FAD-dependent oxidoreductase [Caldisericota bacterium]|nr:FAD-dependent oxidoreductase [Caldisericota bacterium]
MKHVIVGGWVAGTAAASQLRKLDVDAEILVLDAESSPYYSRPGLIDYIAGRKGREQLPLHDAGWYPANGITLRTGTRVTSIDSGARTLHLADGGDVAYDKLLLATGSSPFVPPLPGIDQTGVFAVRTLADADRLRAAASRGQTAVIVGGGVLGLETARALCELGMSAVVLEFAGRLLPNQLDQEGADLLAAILGSMGVVSVVGAESTQVLSDGNAASGILLKDGRRIDGSLVVLSVGVRPNTALARDAGLTVGRGIVVDDFLQTSREGIFAAGDVAEHRGRVYGIVPPALEQGKTAAQNMVHPGSVAYEGSIMSNVLKVVGIDLLSMGTVNPDPASDYEIITARGAGQYRKVILQSGAAKGAIMLGTTTGSRQLQTAIRQGRDLSPWRAFLEDITWSFDGM